MDTTHLAADIRPGDIVKAKGIPRKVVAVAPSALSGILDITVEIHSTVTVFQAWTDETVEIVR